jgi:hypothetical protein
MRVHFIGPCRERIEPSTRLLLKRDEQGGLWYKAGRDILSHFHIVYPGDDVAREQIARDGLGDYQMTYLRSAYSEVEDTQFLLQAPKSGEMHPIERRIVVIAERNPFMYKLSITDRDYKKVPSGDEATITTGSIVSFCGLEFVFHAERPRPKLSLAAPKKIRLEV